MNIYHLFIDFRQAYDSVNRDKLLEIMLDFNIPPKLVRMVKMALRNTRSKVKIQRELTRDFPIKA